MHWFKNAVIYQILIDRFAGCKQTGWDKPVFLGGTIKGIEQKLPYLKELGINTIWISPFYKTSAYHGYHITDFFKVEPRFGTEKDLKQLINSVHKQNMHIIADFVPNHCSDKHPYFLKARKDNKSKYYNWFYFTKWPDNYLCFLNFKNLPKLNLDNPDTSDHIIKAALKWLEFGLDGYRLDHVIGVNHSFWKQFRKQIKSQYPNTVLIGEAWMRGIKFNELKTINVNKKYINWLRGDSSDLFNQYIDELDGVLDFKFQELILKHSAEGKLDQLQKKLQLHYSKYPEDFFLPTFLDNHDMNRFLFECKDIHKLEQAALIQFTTNQPKIIYYGTEVGMTQTKPLSAFPKHGNLQARQPMKWKNQNKELLNYYKSLIRQSK